MNLVWGLHFENSSIRSAERNGPSIDPGTQQEYSTCFPDETDPSSLHRNAFAKVQLVCYFEQCRTGWWTWSCRLEMGELCGYELYLTKAVFKKGRAGWRKGEKKWLGFQNQPLKISLTPSTVLGEKAPQRRMRKSFKLNSKAPFSSVTLKFFWNSGSEQCVFPEGLVCLPFPNSKGCLKACAFHLPKPILVPS